MAKEIQQILSELGLNGVARPSANGLIAASAYWEEQAGIEIQGTNDANGTSIIDSPIDLPAGWTFVGTIVKVSCNEGRSAKVVTVNDGESLGHASEAEHYWVDGQNVGANGEISDGLPLFVIEADNSQARDIYLMAEHTMYNTTNDPTSSYFNGFIGGIMYKSQIEAENV
jgi:hypothetical protein